MRHWANDLIGIPYSVDGNDPKTGFNCWTFAMYVQAKYFGRQLPEVPNPHHYRAIAKAFSNHPERARWQKISNPQDGDLVQICLGAHPCHVGVFLLLDGCGVLHCTEKHGVQFHRLSLLTMGGWTLDGIYRFVGENA